MHARKARAVHASSASVSSRIAHASPARRDGWMLTYDFSRTPVRRGVADAARETGHAVPARLRDQVEAATGQDLSVVRMHTGRKSQEAATQLGARAYTVGAHVHFGQGQYRPGDSEGDRLIVHELIHTMQQRPHLPSGTETHLRVSRPGDPSERDADTMTTSIMAGGRPGHGPRTFGAHIARSITGAEFKNGDATFKLNPYTEVDPDNGKDTARQVGVSFDITHHTGDNYLSDKIAFVQTMKTTKDGSPYLFENEKARATTATEGEAGWAIDRYKGMKSPMYGQENTGLAGSNTIFGYRKSKTDFKDAWMHDALGLNRAVGQKVTVDAVTFAFDETNKKYLGGVSWGFATDAKGTTTKNTPALQSTGDPSGIQKEALKKWNEQAALTDATKKNAADQEKVVVP